MALELRVTEFVRGARAASASEIARSLGVSRSEINSVLYAGLGTEFVKSSDQQPRWSLRTHKDAQPALAIGLIRAKAQHDFHIDFAGGDWLVRIVVGEASRNDPVARVETLGDRHRLITVASYSCGDMEEEHLPAAAIAVAASVLAWEIHQSLRSRGVDAFHFEEAVRDIFLSLQSQSSRV